MPNSNIQQTFAEQTEFQHFPGSSPLPGWMKSLDDDPEPDDDSPSMLSQSGPDVAEIDEEETTPAPESSASEESVEWDDARYHPLARLFPPMSADEFQKLKEDIRQN